VAEGLKQLLADLNIGTTLHDNDAVDGLALDRCNVRTAPDGKNFGAVLAKRFVFFGGLSEILTLLLARYECRVTRANQCDQEPILRR
jgi:hypothetical protein